MKKGLGDGGESDQRETTSVLPVCDPAHAPVPQASHEDLMTSNPDPTCGLGISCGEPWRCISLERK